MAKKGQSTVEYTILLVVVLIVTALVVMLLLNSSRNSGYVASDVMTDYWSRADIALDSWAFNGTHMLLQVKNNLPHDITVSEVRMNNVPLGVSSTALSPGQEATIDGTIGWIASEFGTLYTFDVIIEYTDTLTQNNYLYYGQIPIEGEVIDWGLPAYYST